MTKVPLQLKQLLVAREDCVHLLRDLLNPLLHRALDLAHDRTHRRQHGHREHAEDASMEFNLFSHGLLLGEPAEGPHVLLGVRDRELAFLLVQTELRPDADVRGSHEAPDNLHAVERLDAWERLRLLLLGVDVRLVVVDVDREAVHLELLRDEPLDAILRRLGALPLVARQPVGLELTTIWVLLVQLHQQPAPGLLGVQPDQNGIHHTHGLASAVRIFLEHELGAPRLHLDRELVQSLGLVRAELANLQLAQHILRALGIQAESRLASVRAQGEVFDLHRQRHSGRGRGRRHSACGRHELGRGGGEGRCPALGRRQRRRLGLRGQLRVDAEATALAGQLLDEAKIALSAGGA
mmetsp:Transcript_94192/g.245732  ORF Transcript_94192/g.245732 Transcript_94192/m.245732 type:complete len:352 (+) Transcript_94192:475-1530(+)